MLSKGEHCKWTWYLSLKQVGQRIFRINDIGRAAADRRGRRVLWELLKVVK
jgi:hypothetical protein